MRYHNPVMPSSDYLAGGLAKSKKILTTDGISNCTVFKDILSTLKDPGFLVTVLFLGRITKMLPISD